ncbi:hypothetical protein [Prescottella sp. R16]|uniref:DUF6928 family protein n=1 Tax=Prescottella sp. R16 TaxID=3064529 RepID=UPI00272E6CED|nr:hypothetical protein [Prescottella sp. R16]
MAGVNASTLWYVDVDDPVAVLRDAENDRDGAHGLATSLHHGLEMFPLGDEFLSTTSVLADGEIVVGYFPGVAVVRTTESLPPVPSSLVEHWIRPTGARHTYLCSSSASMPAGSWGAFAHWDGATLERSFSATPVHIVEDVGLPQPWERPFWSGEHPAPPSLDVLPDPQTLPFDPAEFAQAALRAWLDGLDPSSIPVSRFTIHPVPQEPGQQEPVPQEPPAPQEQPRRRSLLARLLRR